MIINGNTLAVLGQKLSIFGGTLKGTLNMGGHALIGLSEPTDNSHASTKFYTDESCQETGNATLKNAKEYVDSLTAFNTITLSADRWEGDKAPFSQAVSCDSVTDKNAVFVSPSEDSRNAYIDSDVHCSLQGNKTLTFECEAKPKVALTVNVMTHEV